MSGVAGYKAQLKLGGTPVIITDEPLTELSPKVFRITNALKRVLSANHTVVVRNSANAIVSVLKTNYLEGVFQIDNIFSFDLPLEVTAYYIPLEYIAGAKEYSLEIGGDVLDDSSFHPDETTLNAGYRTKINGIHDISCSFSRFNNSTNKKLLEAKIAKSPVFVSINPGASSTLIKGWFQIETDSFSGDIGALEDEALSLVLCGNNAQTYFSYCYNYSNVEAEDLTEQELIDNYFFA